jgi:hypothetical protein
MRRSIICWNVGISVSPFTVGDGCFKQWYSFNIVNREAHGHMPQFRQGVLGRFQQLIMGVPAEAEAGGVGLGDLYSDPSDSDGDN